MDPLNDFLSASLSVPLIHPHNWLFKLSFYSAIPESPRADCPLVLFTVCFKQSCSVWLIYLHPPEINDLLSLLRFLFLLDGNGFWLGANVYCVFLNSANLDTGSLVIQMRNHWVLGFVVMGTVRPVTQRWCKVDCFVLNTGFVRFLSLPQSLKFLFCTHEHENNKLLMISDHVLLRPGVGLQNVFVVYFLWSCKGI